MNFDGFVLSDELKMLRKMVKDFIRDEVIPLEEDLDFEATHIQKEKLSQLQEKAKRAGLYQYSVPRKFGGQGLSIFARTIIAEEASQHKLGAYNPALGAFGESPPDILYNGSKRQIERFVYPTLEGKRSGFIAITEPSGGSDPARSIHTRAEKTRNKWVLNGQKVFITGADTADYGIVFARTGEGRQGITAFIVEKGMKGFSHQLIPVIRSWYPCELFFDHVEVPEENILGEVGHGFEYVQKWLIGNRIPYAAGCIGIATAALKKAIEYANIRETFGSKLADKQAIQWMIADSEIELRAARWLTYEAAWKADLGENARYEASSAKLYATEAAGRIMDRVIQIYGGMGLTKELPFERWFRELRIKRVGEGPSEVHRMLISRDLLSGKRKL
ncbi:acyl-CoA dehydrogenase [Lysinibacillus yapensis]|uniref:Acyl-CoA dehydrogenase n=1 Tax=Ureibacillus yapensis TaxID=2304605 RepID=A0A396SP92_9BACL|nr:acyl-CoA dehydrogenase [Lysinibacillus yapensis]